jgi:hypothetical protein
MEYFFHPIWHGAAQRDAVSAREKMPNQQRHLKGIHMMHYKLIEEQPKTYESPKHLQKQVDPESGLALIRL